MPNSQNGYPANNPALVSSRFVPGTTRKLRVRNGPAGDLLLWVAGQFDKLVEDIEQGILDDWGYAERPIRGGVELSNHASGTAIDLNATAHVLGTQPSASFSKQEIDRIHEIVGRTQGCVRWGGDYSGRKDGMHFEIVASEPRCASVLSILNSAPTKENDLTPEEHNMLAQVHNQLTGSRVPDQTPGWPSFLDPNVKMTPVDFIRAIDQNVVQQSAQINATIGNLTQLVLKGGDVDEAALATALAPAITAAIANKDFTEHSPEEIAAAVKDMLRSSFGGQA